MKMLQTEENGSGVIRVTEAVELLARGAAVLDVRTAEERALGLIEPSEHIDLYDPEFEKKIANLDRGKTYIVHCASGNRSRAAAGYMRERGFREVYDLAGGFSAWVREQENRGSGQ